MSSPPPRRRSGCIAVALHPHRCAPLVSASACDAPSRCGGLFCQGCCSKRAWLRSEKVHIALCSRCHDYLYMQRRSRSRAGSEAPAFQPPKGTGVASPELQRGASRGRAQERSKSRVGQRGGAGRRSAHRPQQEVKKHERERPKRRRRQRQQQRQPPPAGQPQGDEEVRRRQQRARQAAQAAAMRAASGGAELQEMQAMAHAAAASVVNDLSTEQAARIALSAAANASVLHAAVAAACNSNSRTAEEIEAIALQKVRPPCAHRRSLS